MGPPYHPDGAGPLDGEIAQPCGLQPDSTVRSGSDRSRSPPRFQETLHLFAKAGAGMIEFLAGSAVVLGVIGLVLAILGLIGAIGASNAK